VKELNEWKECYRELDGETTIIEHIICMRTRFAEKCIQGEPYVGWLGLALALEEELDERDQMRLELEQIRLVMKALDEFMDAYKGQPIPDLKVASAMTRLIQARHNYRRNMEKMKEEATDDS
jgi:hypothetical protein